MNWTESFVVAAIFAAIGYITYPLIGKEASWLYFATGWSLMIAALVATSLARAGVEIWFLGRPSVKGYVIMSLAGFLAGFLAFVKAMESFLW